MRQRTEVKKIRVNGTDLHYAERGKGELVVFVHGGLGDFRTWLPQLKVFGERYRAVSYSRRWHYPNELPGAHAVDPMQQHVQDLAGLTTELGLGRTHLVGNSYGAYLSLVLAIQRPELVRTLILAEPPIHPILRRLPGGEEIFQRFMETAWRPAARVMSEGDMEAGVRLFLDGAVGKGAFDDLPLKMREGILKDAPALKVDALTPYDVFMLDISRDDVKGIEAPTLLLYGQDSPGKYYMINDELARCLPHAEKAVIPGASHVLHSHNPQEHDRVALDFLARHG